MQFMLSLTFLKKMGLRLQNLKLNLQKWMDGMQKQKHRNFYNL